jgi:hypothetical protein
MSDPATFDWIKARSGCSLAIAFERLRQQVSEDTNQRKALLPTPSHYSFNFSSEQPNMFSVVALGHLIHCRVQFTLEDDCIRILSDGFKNKPTFSATLTLNDSGDCRFVVDGIEKDFWHIRKMALETLFFQSYRS